MEVKLEIAHMFKDTCEVPMALPNPCLSYSAAPGYSWSRAAENDLRKLVGADVPETIRHFLEDSVKSHGVPHLT